MTIAFSLIPTGLRTPGIYVEFDNAKAVRGLAGLEHRVLLLVQRRSGGSIAQGSIVEVFSADEGKTYFGAGSVGHAMVERARNASRTARIFALPLSDNGAGTAAIHTVTFTGPASAAGILYTYLAGRRFMVAVPSGMTASQLATAFAAAVNALTDLPGTAAVDGTDTFKVNFTAHHKGLVGNEIDFRWNYNVGEVFPTGIGATVAATTAGAGNPDVTTAIAAMGDEHFTEIVSPWNDSTNMLALEAELDSRWGPLRPIDGHLFIAKDDTVGNLSTFGDSRNSPHVTALGLKNSPTPCYEMAAVLGAVCAEELQRHPARPLTNVALPGVLVPARGDILTRLERDVLLHDGISTAVPLPDGRVGVDRLITMYKTSPAGTVDESYLDLNTIATLSYLRFTFRARIAQRFQRSILADDTNRAGVGQPVVTPKAARLEIISLFDQWEDQGLVTNVEQFIQDLVVKINENDPTRLDVLLPPDLTNPLLIWATRLEFRR